MFVLEYEFLASVPSCLGKKKVQNNFSNGTSVFKNLVALGIGNLN